MNICMKKFGAIKTLFDKITVFELSHFLDALLLNKGFVSAQKVQASTETRWYFAYIM